MLAPALRGAGKVEVIPPDWCAPDRQRLEIATAEASAFLGEQYAPSRIHDGNRQTKWVSPTRPSVAAPQWIALTLAGGPQEVSAVAVFGEAINNDGILNAEIQAESEGQFKTVGVQKNAGTGSWLATFDPVKTSRVRLLITRSGGPTEHIDVWEMEVFGRPLANEETKAWLATRLPVLASDREAVAQLFRSTNLAARGMPTPLFWAQQRLQQELIALRHDFNRWEDLDASARYALAQKADQAAKLAARVRARAQRAALASDKPLLERLNAWDQLRRLTQTSSPLTNIGPQRAEFADRLLAVSVELKSGTWSAAWGGPMCVAVLGATFAAQVDGQDLTQGPAMAMARQTEDPLGQAQELRHIWETNGLRVERDLRMYPGLGVLTIGGRIANETERPVKLGVTRLAQVQAPGGWLLGKRDEAPAAVYVQGHSLLRSSPFPPAGDLDAPEQKAYRSSGVLALTAREGLWSLLIGYVRADEASPDLAADFRLDEGGVSLSATSRFLERVLGPHQAIELNRLYLAASGDSFAMLEAYGDALAKFSPRPALTGPTALWCSWYAHRMGMTEEKVLANAAVAARHFKPLGLDIMQLDHGWQRGDITGDWTPNERFPHGLKWLAGELRQRYGLRLGVWIAPTDVAETSDLFKQHPDWMLKGDDGKPRVNWRWYWRPNPNCYELDATHPQANQYIRDVFRQLTGWGVSYYKIDFIASAGGEQFVPADPQATRGWSALRRAMEAVRAGAGEPAWIRHCQTPPVLSAGLANSAYGGDDTLDAGVAGRFDLLRDNAHALAAGYWLNDRPYHREVCDMSVRMQGSVEEVRVRAALMTLANCSISWSDELCYLPPSRIHLMQQCLPPGNPPMRPLDLFERDVPSVWHIKVRSRAGAWEVVGLFNFDNTPAPRAIQFDQLGLEANSEYTVFEFWEQQFLGVRKGGLELTLPPQSSRILAIRKLTGIPQLVGTDMHLLQGCHEVKQLDWDAGRGVLHGAFERAPGVAGKAFFYLPPGYYPKFDFPMSPASARLTHVEGPLWMQEIEFTDREFSWTIPFETPKKTAPNEPSGA
jgi:alpha-galactosidase